jgi:tetratricopeptide (TPR) repeat protein
VLVLGCAPRAGSGGPADLVHTNPEGAEPTVFVEVPPEPRPPEPEPTEPSRVAQPVDIAAREQARQLFSEAVQLFEAGNYAAAVVKFEAAYQLAPLPQLLFNIARALEQQGDVAAACQVYRSASTDPTSDDRLRAEAANRLAQLRCP